MIQPLYDKLFFMYVPEGIKELLLMYHFSHADRYKNSPGIYRLMTGGVYDRRKTVSGLRHRA